MIARTLNLKSYLRKGYNVPYRILTRGWTRFWMRYAGLDRFGRVATRLATWFAPPHKARVFLSYMNPRGYIAPSVTIYHSDLQLGTNVFVDERVVIFQRKGGGSIKLGEHVCIYRDTIIETGYGGSLTIGAETSIHPRCQINAYQVPVQIGSDVMIAPNCALYPYDHGVAPDRPIIAQPLVSKGSIVIGDGAWLGVGVIVLGGVRIGEGAVIGAGSVVTQDVPDGAIAVGVPARVVKMRSNLA
ncbi:MAG: DapH/DapD/GlmU-related protein [Chloroflexota bacterium]|nr:DapH/DapD/GlmU-related protein [Chloroflexota bacterium]